ncbi:MAG: hypothetical protein GXP34_08065 [Actinobacteria bacterium]|nr:hypothetical protein [Actinomycetota bacterium]
MAADLASHLFVDGGEQILVHGCFFAAARPDLALGLRVGTFAESELGIGSCRFPG